MGRKEKERMQKMDSIIMAAEKVFHDKGFEDATMDDIASVAEYSKGALYFYFKGKNDLCLAIVNKNLIQIKEMFTEILNSNCSGLESFKRLVLAYIDFQKKHPYYSKSISNFRSYHLNCEVDNDYMIQNTTINNDINEVIKNIIIKGLKDYSIRKNIEPEKTANSIWGNLTGILPGFVLQDNSETKYSSSELFDYIFNLIIRGMASEI
jgi:AcrR family transcriptional regulator